MAVRRVAKRVGVGLLGRLRRQVNRLEKLQLEEYLLYITDTRRYFVRNFLAGLARGLEARSGLRYWARSWSLYSAGLPLRIYRL